MERLYRRRQSRTTSTNTEDRTKARHYARRELRHAGSPDAVSRPGFDGDF